mmetsp:Transcript_22186/g.44586  ORF Transcript_22186/g.44586 Transcript_22186/m.44586 type:complete len:550 (+) Transcript_22186:77-1726(+)
MKSQSSQYRTQICSLTPKLAFLPSSTSSSNDADFDNVEHQMLLWRNQLREEELWNDAQTNTLTLLREIISFHSHNEKDRESSSLIADELMQQFGRRIIVHPTSTIMNVNNTENIKNEQHNDAWLTIYDFEKIAQILQDHCGEDGPTEFVQNSNSIAQHLRVKQVVVPPSNMSWHEVIIISSNDAAYTILQIYDKETSKQHIRQYLNYRAIRTMEQIKYFTLPFQKRQLLQLEEYHCKQQQLLTELERCYNDAFEKLDDYCMNILGVESDTLPLFPEQLTAAEVDGGYDAVAKGMDDYSDQVARHVRAIMMDELNKNSIRLLAFLGDNGKAISTAIEYYLQFTDFLSSVEWRDGQEPANHAKHEVMMSTLKQFVISSSDSLTTEFIHSPSARVMLVSDLQQLNSFLISRKFELSSRVGTGRDVMEAIDLAWTQHSSKPGCNLNDITVEDISQYSAAVQNVLAQIVGDGMHAKRLRLLADALGCEKTEETFRFNLLCRRAASLAYQMSLYQSQREASALTMKRCKSDVEMKDEEIRLDTCRLEVLTTSATK